MRATTAIWLADLLTVRADDLAADLGSFARQQIPVYVAEDRERLDRGLAEYYIALARTVGGGDMAPLRGYLERVVSVRLQEGAQGADFIRLINHAEEQMQALIAREATGPAQRSEAQRLARGLGRNARLIISEVNLQLLVDPAHYDEHLAFLPPPRQPTQPTLPAA
jgi:hypothetical protein